MASYLKVHKMSHTGHKLFAYDVCSKAFNTAINLKEHKMSNTGIKSFFSDVCSTAFSFTMASTLNVHKMSHAGYKPFACVVCSSYLKVHKILHFSQTLCLCVHVHTFNKQTNWVLYCLFCSTLLNFWTS